MPQPAWGSAVANAHLLGTGRLGGKPVWIVSFVNPDTPAWFTAWIDRSTYRPLRLKMTAAAHFMRHTYLEFDRPLRIVPARSVLRMRRSRRPGNGCGRDRATKAEQKPGLNAHPEALSRSVMTNGFAPAGSPRLQGPVADHRDRGRRLHEHAGLALGTR